MLSLRLLKGYDIEPPNIPLKHSASCTNFYRTTSSNFSSFRRTTSTSFFSIYQKSNINKAPRIGQLEKKMRILTSRIKSSRKEMINSIHRNTMRERIKQKLDDFYLTGLVKQEKKPKHERNKKHDEYKKLEQLRRTQNFNFNPNNSYKTDKMMFNIGLLFHKGNTSQEFVRNLNDIIIMKDCYSVKKENYLKIKDDKYTLQKQIENDEHRLLYNKKLLTKGYENTYLSYLNFLHTRILNEKSNSDYLRSLRGKLFLEVTKLKLDVNNVKHKIEYLLEIRNFLIKVKEHRLVLPYFFEEMSREMSNAYFMTNSELKTDSEKITSNIEYDEQREKYRQYLDIKKPIFQSPEEFMMLYYATEAANLNLLKKNDETKYNVQIMKTELEQLIIEEREYDASLQKKIEMKQKAFDIIYSVHKQLINQLQNILLSTSSNLNSNKLRFYKSMNVKLKTKRQSVSQETFDKDMVIVMKYKEEQKKYSLYNTVLFYKLTSNVQNFLDRKIITVPKIIELNVFRTVSDFEKCISFIPNVEEKNKLFPNLLSMLKIYEICCLNIIEKHKRLLNTPRVKDEVIRLMNQQQIRLKIKNINEQRQLIEKKRIYEENKIMEKNMKIIIKPKKKVQDKYRKCKLQKEVEAEKAVIKNPDDNLPTFHDFIDVYEKLI